MSLNLIARGLDHSLQSGTAAGASDGENGERSSERESIPYHTISYHTMTAAATSPRWG